MLKRFIANLKISHKVSLIAVLSLLMLAVPTTILFNNQLGMVHIAESEAAGLPPPPR